MAVTEHRDNHPTDADIERLRSDDVHPHDAAELAAGLSDTGLRALLAAVGDERAAAIYSHLPVARQVEFAASVPSGEVASLLAAMESDDRVDLVRELPAAVSSPALALLGPADRADIERLGAYDEDTIEAVVALVFFLPLLIDSGGNAGNQSATLMVRALATGEVRMKDWLRLHLVPSWLAHDLPPHLAAQARVAGPVLAALVLGALIGVERQLRWRTAGLRTNTLVGVGSALYLSPSFLAQQDAQGVSDPTRVAAQVVSGIGFPGAGVILREGLTIRGLNTAATLWTSAAVGCLCRGGLRRDGVLRHDAHPRRQRLAPAARRGAQPPRRVRGTPLVPGHPHLLPKRRPPRPGAGLGGGRSVRA